jgi:hypothetical protein
VQLTQNPAALSRQWVHSWMVCGSRAGRTLVRSLSRGGRGRAPTRGFEVVIVRAGAGSGECVVHRDGPGRVAAVAAGPATRQVSSMTARLVRLARQQHTRWTWFMRTSADFHSREDDDHAVGHPVSGLFVRNRVHGSGIAEDTLCDCRTQAGKTSASGRQQHPSA